MSSSNTKLFTLKTLQSDFPRTKITTSKSAYDFIKQFYSDDIEIFESFFILLLNRNNMTIGYAKISQGGVSCTVVDSKIIGKYIVDSLASHIILAHNHPSGSIRPSDADIDLTKKLKMICQLLDCNLLDHIILTATEFHSMADNGNI